MSTWSEAIELYKTELIKTKTKHEKQLEQSKKRLHKLKITKSIILMMLNKEIRSLKSKIEDQTENIKTHDTLIQETEDGTLDKSDSD